MINLKIDPEFQSQIPPLTDDEFKQLEENILKEGKLLSPLIVWNNTLVDGHNRYAILQKHIFKISRAVAHRMAVFAHDIRLIPVLHQLFFDLLE